MVDNGKSPSDDELTLLIGGDFSMAKKGSKFVMYTPEVKEKAVRLYLEDGVSALQVAAQLGLKSKTQVLEWVKRHQRGETFTDGRGKPAWRKGRPKTKFASIEEELAYVKAEVEYLKKRYPNLHKG
jgi:transposase